MPSLKESCGIIYVATREIKYLLDASLSALSCRQMGYKGSISLFTNLSMEVEVPSLLFDKVIPITANHNFEDDWTSGKHHKLQSLIDTPYDITLYLDADARAYASDISTFPNLLKNADIAMATVGPADSFTAKTLDSHLYNSGVIAYRKTKGVMSMLNEWQSLSRGHHRMLNKGVKVSLPDYMLAVIPNSRLRKLLRMDQLGLYMLMNPDRPYAGISMNSLPARWNNRDHTFIFPVDTILHHTNRYRRQFAKDVKLAAEYCEHIQEHATVVWLNALLTLEMS